ncbi:helix-turn-helix domain-containing protein [Bacteroides fragilis]|uniref:helix-turn-helix domain-containing protein n=1 Tax=Bacteroides faecis TaxID=674529 RepID=UPI003854826C
MDISQDYSTWKLKKMLSCSKNDIQKITDALGFTDQASFSKFFKRFAGVSPTEYRNNIKNNKNSCLEKYPK